MPIDARAWLLVIGGIALAILLNPCGADTAPEAEEALAARRPPTNPGTRTQGRLTEISSVNDSACIGTPAVVVVVTTSVQTSP